MIPLAWPQTRPAPIDAGDFSRPVDSQGGSPDARHGALEGQASLDFDTSRWRATLVAGYLCVRHWPATTVTIDPIKTPFYGPYQANGFIHRTIDDTQGLRRAHKLIVGATLLVALLGAFRWWKTDLVRWAWGLIKALLEKRPKGQADNGGGLVIVVLLAVLLAKEMPSLRKTPDFTNCTLRIMSSMNMHISI